MLQFAYPHLLWLTLAIPVAVVIYMRYLWWRKRKLRSLGDTSVVNRMISGADTNRGHYKMILQLFAFALLVLAVAKPQVASRSTKRVITGGDIVICLDVSNSMLAEDIRPNRLIRARQAITTLLRQLDNEQVGLVVFAGEAFIQVPLTIDKTAAIMLLNNISARDISNQGTAIADAINLAVRSFGDVSGKNSSKTIILVTDGEDHEGSVIEEAKLAAGQGVTIFTLGVGNPNGAPIPKYEDGLLSGYLKDNEGNTVISSLNPKLLAEVAEITGGKFFLSTNLNIAMQRIRTEMKNSSGNERAVLLPDEAEQQYGWFAGFALLILALERMIPYRGDRRGLLEKINGLIR